MEPCFLCNTPARCSISFRICSVCIAFPSCSATQGIRIFHGRINSWPQNFIIMCPDEQGDVPASSCMSHDLTFLSFLFLSFSFFSFFNLILMPVITRPPAPGAVAPPHALMTNSPLAACAGLCVSHTGPVQPMLGARYLIKRWYRPRPPPPADQSLDITFCQGTMEEEISKCGHGIIKAGRG